MQEAANVLCHQPRRGGVDRVGPLVEHQPKATQEVQITLTLPPRQLLMALEAKARP